MLWNTQEVQDIASVVNIFLQLSALANLASSIIMIPLSAIPFRHVSHIIRMDEVIKTTSEQAVYVTSAPFDTHLDLVGRDFATRGIVLIVPKVDGVVV